MVLRKMNRNLSDKAFFWWWDSLKADEESPHAAWIECRRRAKEREIVAFQEGWEACVKTFERKNMTPEKKQELKDKIDATGGMRTPTAIWTMGEVLKEVIDDLLIAITCYSSLGAKNQGA
jgi:hypothetical protein